MQIRLLAFAQTRDQLGFDVRVIDCVFDDTPRAVLSRIAPDFDAASLRVAVDCQYRGWDEPIGEARELALIPPVSGG